MAALSQAIGAEPGDPAAKMLNPWLPLRLNFTGTALPAFTPFMTGRLSIGWKKPVQLKTTDTVKLPVAVLPWPSVIS